MKPQAGGSLQRTGQGEMELHWSRARESGPDGEPQPPATGGHTAQSLEPDFTWGRSSTVRSSLQTTSLGCECCGWPLVPRASPRASRAKDTPWTWVSLEMPPHRIPPVAAQCYCIDKPIPSDFLSLRDV